MFRSTFTRISRPISTMSRTPIEDAIRTKVRKSCISSKIAVNTVTQINEALNPSTLEIFNDSSKHAHHKAMQGSLSKETHFRLVITSEIFQSKLQPARHRMIYALLKEELERPGGIHALQLRTRTLAEEQRQLARENEEQGEEITDIEQDRGGPQ